jgi:hypothetical protein
MQLQQAWHHKASLAQHVTHVPLFMRGCKGVGVCPQLHVRKHTAGAGSPVARFALRAEGDIEGMADVAMSESFHVTQTIGNSGWVRSEMRSCTVLEVLG